MAGEVEFPALGHLPLVLIQLAQRDLFASFFSFSHGSRVPDSGFRVPSSGSRGPGLLELVLLQLPQRDLYSTV